MCNPLFFLESFRPKHTAVRIFLQGDYVPISFIKGKGRKGREGKVATFLILETRHLTARSTLSLCREFSKDGGFQMDSLWQPACFA